jgi:branched-subunit amino acid aminotransferase/4-amino-4-deoxychorismate lyase
LSAASRPTVTTDPAAVQAEVNGEPVALEQALALATAAFGHFSALVVDESRVLGLQLHLDRLVRDCAQVFGATLDPVRVRGLLRRVAEQCDRPTMLRATVFDPAFSVARPGLSDPDQPPSVLISTRPVAPAGSRPGLRVRSTDFVRQLPRVKHLGSFGQLNERRQAQLAGFDDALFFTGPEPSARVCEGPTWNVALLVGEDLIWPDDHCLPGISRELIRQMFQQTGRPWISRPVTRAELPQVRAAFATSTGVGAIPITQIDSHLLPGDPALLAELQTGYAALVPDPL